MTIVVSEHEWLRGTYVLCSRLTSYSHKHHAECKALQASMYLPGRGDHAGQAWCNLQVFHQLHKPLLHLQAKGMANSMAVLWVVYLTLSTLKTTLHCDWHGCDMLAEGNGVA